MHLSNLGTAHLSLKVILGSLKQVKTCKSSMVPFRCLSYGYIDYASCWQRLMGTVIQNIWMTQISLFLH